MNNKKRAFMVPVMTLAVCAIAMVGLGFALTTSVTTEKNVVGKLMVDISSTTPADGWEEPVDGNDISSLLSFGIQSVKVKDTSEPTKYSVSKYLVSKDAKLKIFGNMANVELSVTATGLTSDGVKKIEFTINGPNTATATVTVTLPENGNAQTKCTGSFTANLTSNQVYTIKITKVNDVSVSTDTPLQSTNLESLSGIVGANLTFTFTANNTTNTTTSSTTNTTTSSTTETS